MKTYSFIKSTAAVAAHSFHPHPGLIALMPVRGHAYGITPRWIGRLLGTVVGVWVLLLLLVDIADRSGFRLACLLSLPAMIAAVLGIRYVVMRGLRSDAASTLGNEVPADSTDARLVCYGDALELGRLRELEVEWCEPHIALRQLPLVNVQTAVVFCAVLTTAALLTRTLPLPFPSYWVFGALIGGFVWGYPRLRPVFYRVAPGRIEVMRFPLFGSAGTIVHSIDLSRARVVCEYHRMRLGISNDDSAGGGISISLLGVSAPHELAEAVFRASVYSTRSPRLPNSELLG